MIGSRLATKGGARLNSKPSIFEQHIRSYLEQLERLDMAPLADRLGVSVENRLVTVPLFGRLYRVTSEGIERPDGRPADYSTTVIICRYLLQCPDFEPPEGRWQTYKDFPDAAPLVHYFATNVEKAIADHFSGRLEGLRNAARQLGGQRPPMELSYDFLSTIVALPRVPILLLFNEADDDFPAQSTVLFENRVQHYLDMECVSMVGTLLVKHLLASR